MRSVIASLAVLGALLASCRGAPPQAAYVMDQVPEELAPAVAAADSAITLLQQRLSRRLLEEMGRGGPAAAMQVCKLEAQAITAEVAATRNIDVGRTSDRLRNRKNAPRGWVEPFVRDTAGKKASEVGPRVVDLGARVGVVRPIAMGRLCARCHGAPETIEPDVALVLRDAYPKDRAVGFEEGDLRGWFWAEVAK